MAIRIVGGMMVVVLVAFLGFLLLLTQFGWLWTGAFGLACALCAPICARYLRAAATAKADRDLLIGLGRVPEIDQMIAKANTEEERVQRLREEQKRIAIEVREEARRLSIERRQAELLDTVTSIVSEWDALEVEAAELGVSQAPTAAAEVADLRKRIEQRQRGARSQGSEFEISGLRFRVPRFGTAPELLFILFLDLSWQALRQLIAARRGRRSR